MRKNSLGLTAAMPVTIYGLKVKKKKVNKSIYMNSVIELSSGKLIKVVADDDSNKAITSKGLLLYRCMSYDNSQYKSISQDKNGKDVFYKYSEININSGDFIKTINEIVSKDLMAKFKSTFPL